jgi:hypothetical protein
MGLETALAVRWACLATIWRQRTLGLSYVEKIDVEVTTRTVEQGTANVQPKRPDYEYVVTVAISILLDRTTLPMG